MSSARRWPGADRSRTDRAILRERSETFRPKPGLIAHHRVHLRLDNIARRYTLDGYRHLLKAHDDVVGMLTLGMFEFLARKVNCLISGYTFSRILIEKSYPIQNYTYTKLYLKIYGFHIVTTRTIIVQKAEPANTCRPTTPPSIPHGLPSTT
jgi:hypothetical protein